MAKGNEIDRCGTCGSWRICSGSAEVGVCDNPRSSSFSKPRHKEAVRCGKHPAMNKSKTPPAPPTKTDAGKDGQTDAGIGWVDSGNCEQSAAG